LIDIELRWESERRVLLLHDGLVAAWPNALAKQTMHMHANEMQRKKAEKKTTGRSGEETEL
jgi:hypothetical protein